MIERQKKNPKAKKVFGTHEWAETNCNFISGCSHDCKYCYSKEMAIRFGRKTPETWKDESIREHDVTKFYKQKKGMIMFPSSHDISPNFINEAIIILEKLIENNNKILIVTKPHLLCIEKICSKFENKRNQILFRFTIGSSNSEILKFWEPGAPSFEERFESLKFAYNAGFETSVSCEPLLDKNIEQLIDKILPFITDAIWIGKANFLLKRMKTNGITDINSLAEAQNLVNWQSDSNQIFSIYDKYKTNTKIKWKESIKKVVNIEIPFEKGLDI